MAVKILCLLSGGIDSAVASYMMIKRGFDVALLHLKDSPYSDSSIPAKAEAVTRKLKEYHEEPLKLYTANHGENLSEIIRNCNIHLTCVLCKRFMYRIAEQVATKECFQAVVTGESIGQVASQTLTNLRAISSAIKIPVLRPLIGLDKEEIMTTARKIGTFGISTQPGICCTAVPSKPSTSATQERVANEERKLNIDLMLRRTLDTLDLRLIS
jgi:thiamine biosynthesis protein ThiI